MGFVDQFDHLLTDYTSFDPLDLNHSKIVLNHDITAQQLLNKVIEVRRGFIVSDATKHMLVIDFAANLTLYPSLYLEMGMSREVLHVTACFLNSMYLDDTLPKIGHIIDKSADLDQLWTEWLKVWHVKDSMPSKYKGPPITSTKISIFLRYLMRRYDQNS